MNVNAILLIPVLLPILGGACLSFLRFKRRGALLTYVMSVGAVSVAAVFCAASLHMPELHLWALTDKLPLFLRLDDAGKLFSVLGAVLWLLCGVFACRYMDHEGGERRFFAFYLCTLGVLMGLDYSGNLVTMYLFYELVTLCSMPLVLHSLSKEAIAAALKYLFYSIAGAFLALLGIFFVYNYGTTLEFIAGGVLDLTALAGHEGTMLTVTFLMLIGFGTKAGIVPMHGWLPAAHPVAPAPASALLSGIIAKAGAFAILRILYYIIGPDFFHGSWVQYAWITMTLITIFTGSVVACRENNLKRRLAYSTVSQISYILLGLALLDADSFAGGMMHVVFHAVVKCALFLIAGIIIYKTGITEVSEMRGIGKRLPVEMCCWTLASLALIGIPPTSGFVSKWYLATGALSSGLSVLSWLAPVILLLSALLTASYLLPLSINGFFPGADFKPATLERAKPSYAMLVPVVILSALAVILGLWAGPLLDYIRTLSEVLL